MSKKPDFLIPPSAVRKWVLSEPFSTTIEFAFLPALNNLLDDLRSKRSFRRLVNRYSASLASLCKRLFDPRRNFVQPPFGNCTVLGAESFYPLSTSTNRGPERLG